MNNKAEVQYILDSMGVGEFLNLYTNVDEIESILMKLGRPLLCKNYKREIERDIKKMVDKKIINKKTGEENPNLIYSDDECDSSYETETSESSEEEYESYGEMIQVIKGDDDFYYLE